MLTVQPITLREAWKFVSRVHRHHKAPQGGLFAVAASEGDVVRAVVIVVAYFAYAVGREALE